MWQWKPALVITSVDGVEICLNQWSSNLGEHRNYPGGLLKHTLPGPSPLGFRFRRSGWGLRICISIKFPGDVHLVLETTS